MLNSLVFLSAIAFIAFLIIPQDKKKYCAVAGWIFIVLSLILDLPFYIYEENNFLYPMMAVLSIPFLIITVSELLRDNNLTIYLSRGAAIAFLIYFPFGYIPELGNWLIGTVAGQVAWIGAAIGCHYSMVDWNLLQYSVFRVEIIHACTGIQSIAIMLGLSFCLPTTLKQKIYSFLVLVPVIYILNLFRNVFVVEAYTQQWFNFLPEIASNGEYGYESFFWAHNVLAELGALVFLIVLALAIFKIIPDLGDFARDLINLYAARVREWTGKKSAKTD